MSIRVRARLPFLLALALTACQSGPFARRSSADPAARPPQPSYPDTAMVGQVDDYHGTQVTDPYRWMEDAQAPQVKEWVDAQNQVTRAWLEAVPERARIERRLTELWDYAKEDAPRRVGNLLVFFRNDGLQSQDVYYKQADDGEPEVLLDPNTLSADGTVALSAAEFSHDGRWLAYGVSSGGSDWREWHVRNVQTTDDLPDVLRWSKFSGVAWSPDNQGFYYGRYPAPEEGQELEAANFNMAVYYHRLGDAQADDRLVFETPDHPEWGFAPLVTEDGRYLFLGVWQGTDDRTVLYVQDLVAGGDIRAVFPEFKAKYIYLHNVGSTVFFQTNDGAPLDQVVALELDSMAFRTVIPEAAEALTGATVLNGQFVLTYLHNASHQVRIHDLDGTFVRRLDLPGIGSVGGFTGKADATETWYTFSSFTSPSTVYHHDLTTGESTVRFRPDQDFDPSGYETRLEFARSKDGTAVPLMITMRRGLERDGSHPVLLYGYGGFNIPLTPRFSTSNLVWLEMGGVYVQAVLRGGSEYGESWHRAGMLANKQNVFDDFIAAGEHLIEQGYTTRERLAIHGGSNGGTLVGACVNQRPDLYAAAIPAVGVMDMLRFHRFTIGWAWVSEYGSSDDPEQFRTLYAYSPLHNIRPGTDYPAVMVMTGDHDDRVVPAHSFKYAATLQKAQAGDAPILIRIETRAGHGAGKPTAMLIAEQADKWAFLVGNLDFTPRW